MTNTPTPHNPGKLAPGDPVFGDGVQIGYVAGPGEYRRAMMIPMSLEGDPTVYQIPVIWTQDGAEVQARAAAREGNGPDSSVHMQFGGTAESAAENFRLKLAGEPAPTDDGPRDLWPGVPVNAGTDTGPMIVTSDNVLLAGDVPPHNPGDMAPAYVLDKRWDELTDEQRRGLRQAVEVERVLRSMTPEQRATIEARFAHLSNDEASDAILNAVKDAVRQVMPWREVFFDEARAAFRAAGASDDAMTEAALVRHLEAMSPENIALIDEVYGSQEPEAARAQIHEIVVRGMEREARGAGIDKWNRDLVARINMSESFNDLSDQAKQRVLARLNDPDRVRVRSDSMPASDWRLPPDTRADPTKPYEDDTRARIDRMIAEGAGRVVDLQAAGEPRPANVFTTDESAAINAEFSGQTPAQFQPQIDAAVRKAVDEQMAADRVKRVFNAENTAADQATWVDDTAPLAITQKGIDRVQRVFNETNDILDNAALPGDSGTLHDTLRVKAIPPAQLYHYTSTTHWPEIQKAGRINRAASTPDPRFEVNATGVVHLSDEPNLTPATANWARGSVVDKTKVRITVNAPDAIHWPEFARMHGLEQVWYDALAKAGGDPDHWWVVPREIPASEWTEVRIGDVPVGKRPPQDLVGTAREPWQAVPLDQPWLNNEGKAALCDFCGDPQSGCSYRYTCPEFVLAGLTTEWVNGGSPVHPGDGDWGACWVCSKLVQQVFTKGRGKRVEDIRRIGLQSIIRRNHDAMSELGTEILSGKHGTEDGKFAPQESRARIEGFFAHATGKRVFVGKCDFCSAHGPDTKWVYPARSYRSLMPYWRSGNKTVVTNVDDAWIACETCSGFIERRKTGALVDRMMDRQKTSWQSIKAPPTVVRDSTTEWLNGFLKHRAGPRQLLEDLPPRVEAPPPAPMPAQIALETQLALLRWVDTTEGRLHIGRMNAQFAGTRPKLADENEVESWLQPLKYGETYYWEPRIANAMTQAARELAEQPGVGWTLQAEALPAPQGFFYSDVPIGVTEASKVRAIGWTIIYEAEFGRMSPTEPDRQAVDIVLNAHGGGNPQDAAGIALSFWVEDANHRLRPSGLLVWAYGMATNRMFASQEAQALAEQHGERPEAFASMLSFIQERIVVASHRMGVGRALRKRMETEHPTHMPMVRIITLRRVQSIDYQRPEESSGRTLSVQFRVRGHWRMQCHNPRGHREAEETGVGCQDHQAVYVHPFMKGPNDAPLHLSRADIMDVAQ